MFLKAYMLLIAEIIGMSINMHKAKKCATISHRNVHQVVSYIYNCKPLSMVVYTQLPREIRINSDKK